MRKLELYITTFFAFLVLALFLGPRNPNVTAAPSPIAPTQFTEKVEYYEVAGATAQQIRKEMSSKGPQDAVTGARFDGFTRWNVSWDYRCEGDRLTDISVTGSSRVTLPKWIAPPDAPESLEREWSEYAKALKGHENGHVDHGKSARNEIEVALKKAEGACKGDRSPIADTKAGAIVQKWAERDREYDRETGHGATQGAIFPKHA